MTGQNDRETTENGSKDDLSNVASLQQPDESPRDLSDDTLALQFAAEFHSNAQYTPTSRTWYVWDSTRWKRDETNAAHDHCRRMLRAIATRCFKAAYKKGYIDMEVPDETGRARARRRDAVKAAAFKQVKPLKSKRTMDAVLQMSCTDPRITTAPDKWDGEESKYLLNTPLGTLELKTGTLRPARQGDRITKLARVGPGNMPTPTWDRFLLEATDGNLAMISYLQRVFGYCMTGDTSEQTLFFCHGPTGTGKSVLTNAISYVLGDYRYDTSEGTFSEKSMDRHTQDIARLVNARFVTAQETEANSKWNEARIKRLTGQDKITARLMRQNDFEYTPQMKIFIVGNHKPQLSSMDDAVKRRFNIIPLRTQPKHINKQLGWELEQEASGIMAWMLKGCLQWQEIGLQRPPIVEEYTERYLYEEDSISQWVEDRCILSPIGWAQVGELYHDWRRWAAANDIIPGTKGAFSEYLESRTERYKLIRKRKAKGPGFAGIALVSKSEGTS